jgi:hypothetical protein
MFRRIDNDFYDTRLAGKEAPGHFHPFDTPLAQLAPRGYVLLALIGGKRPSLSKRAIRYETPRTDMDRRSQNVMTRPSRRKEALYSSKIIKAGALLPDTKTLISSWDASATVSDNLSRFRRDNVFGKASRSRVEDILAVFRQRYLTDERDIKALCVLVKKGLPSASLDRILYFHAAQSDRLLHDIVVDWLFALQARGVIEIDVDEASSLLTKCVAEGKTTAKWSEDTTRRVAQGLLATLRDFGVLQGVVRKKIASHYLPVTDFAYVMFYLKQREPSGVKLIDHADWRLFFLNREEVEGHLFEAHQQGLLEYHAAGSVTRLGFTSSTPEEYAHVLADRAN